MNKLGALPNKTELSGRVVEPEPLLYGALDEGELMTAASPAAARENQPSYASYDTHFTAQQKANKEENTRRNPNTVYKKTDHDEKHIEILLEVCPCVTHTHTHCY